ncbi:MAG: cobalamin biosynthesis protein CbiX, partial [Rhodobacteraceae bacterium]|nr:cobalamin biosynthesis protein CbiX [Paracoccaceae bacterium]
ETALLVAAHGSAVSQKNAETTMTLTDHLEKSLGFKSACAGFVEQDPFLGDVALDLGQAICLPFFALRAGHYIDDVPEALASAEFSGPVLPPFIEWPQTVSLIAESLATQIAQHEAAQ